jgi:hypothetical protein
MSTKPDQVHFQDGAETNAAMAVLNGLRFKDLFTDELLKKECCGK